MRDAIRHTATAAAESRSLRPGPDTVRQQQLLVGPAAAKVDDAAVGESTHVIQADLQGRKTQCWCFRAHAVVATTLLGLCHQASVLCSASEWLPRRTL